jgi:hypothetical protein
MLIRQACLTCGSSWYKTNGHTRHGKQNHHYKVCERQCGATAEDRLISDERRTVSRKPQHDLCSTTGEIMTSLALFLHFPGEALWGDIVFHRKLIPGT